VAPDPFPAVDPIGLLIDWLSAARQAGAELPEAATLATITAGGWPSARMVMVRGLDRGLVFFTDSESDKGAELAVHPRAALVLHWLVPEHRQVRVVGPVEPAGDEAADRYWDSRRPEARRSAAASRQSQVITGRAELEERVDDLARRFAEAHDLPRPERWVGYRVMPAAIEFWQEAADGLHDRCRYDRSGTSWTVSRLSP
jgi:pyridoxamine 5'-phosphate oxidase